MTTNKAEYGLRNYMKKNRIYPLNQSRQTDLIYEFFRENGGKHGATWAEVIKFTQDRFASFSQYANRYSNNHMVV